MDSKNYFVTLSMYNRFRRDRCMSDSSESEVDHSESTPVTTQSQSYSSSHIQSQRQVKSKPVHSSPTIRDYLVPSRFFSNLNKQKGYAERRKLAVSGNAKCGEPAVLIDPKLNNSSNNIIASSTKRIFHNMQWKSRASDASLDQSKHLLGLQTGDVASSVDRQPLKLSNNQQSQQHSDSRINDINQFNQYPSDLNVEATPNQSREIRYNDMMGTKEGKTAPNLDSHYREFPPNNYKELGGNYAPNFRDDNRRDINDSQFYFPAQGERQTSPGSEGELSLPAIEVFQIIGEAKPGSTLKACGYGVNGTTVCDFQWFRHYENGTRQSIEGAQFPDYVVTADDVGTFLAVDCTPIDDNGRQGELVRLFADYQNKIACDPGMQHEIDTHISAGKANFPVLLLTDSSAVWERAILALDRNGYQIKANNSSEAVLKEEKYSLDLCIEVPTGPFTRFVLMCSDGMILLVSTRGMTQAYNYENSIRLRDIIVLTMRYFQDRALDGKMEVNA